MGDLPKLPVHKPGGVPPITNNLVSNDWAVKLPEKAKYDQLFDSLQPQNGMIAGNKVRGVLMESKLSMDVLGRIWDLADMDKDGMLDRHEFMVAMHLVYKALGKCPIPAQLPPELLPPAKRKEQPPQFAAFPASIPIVSAPPPSVVPAVPAIHNGMVLAQVVKPVVPPQPVTPWVVSAEDRAKYDALFHLTDIDKDGFVSGLEIKDVFLRSGVPQPMLAHIWSLCDIKQSGKLNSEQFALSMWCINQQLQGSELPSSLTPEMIPPGFRAAASATETTSAPYSNPELDMITKDIEELAIEKHTLETDIAQKEADISVKSGEIKSLQSELDTLAATLKQLENQKGEAQKRLNDLKGQKSAVDKELSDIHLEIEEEQTQVDNLRLQADQQEASLKTQEEELSSKKQELESLKQEEAGLETKQRDSRSQLDGLTKNLQDTQLQISQAKNKISQLQEQSRQMSDAIASCDSAIAVGDASAVGDTCLSIAPHFQDPEYSKIAMLNGGSPTDQSSVNNTTDPFSNTNGHSTAFGNENLFQNDPFKSAKPAVDPFSSNDPFAAAFPAHVSDGFAADPFNSFGAPSKPDPFDPFGDGKNRAGAKSPVDMSGKDEFGCDPFAVLHAPTRPERPESPSPALPPKKSKQPPPRPAPPRPSQQPTMRAAPPPPDPSRGDAFAPGSVTNGGSTAHKDPFAGNTGANAFADFADFDTKCLQTSFLYNPSVRGTSIISFNENPSSDILWSTFFANRDSNFTNTKAEVIDKTIQNVSKLPTVQLSNTKPKPPQSTTQHRYAGMEFTEDPFRNYRYEDPFEIADPFDDELKDNSVQSTNGANLDPFGLAKDVAFESDLNKPKVNVGGSRSPRVVPPEDQQLAWAAAESLRVEGERRQRLQQEQADLEYALALSRADKKAAK